MILEPLANQRGDPYIIATRDPNSPAVPNGSIQNFSIDSAVDAIMAAVGVVSPATQIIPRYIGPAEISVATGSVATNDSPTFLDGANRLIGRTVVATKEAGSAAVEGAKSLTGAVGSIVGNILPWWLWGLVGLALVAWIATLLAPALRRS